MLDIVFVKTRWNYDSYTDFWKLVELSDFATVYTDQIDPFDYSKVYIVSPMNGEWKPIIDTHFPNGRYSYGNIDVLAKLVLWNLERPSGSGGLEEYRISNLKLIQDYFDKIIVSDRMLARYTSLNYVTLGIHSGLGEPGLYEEKFYDIIHLSCYSNSRSWLFDRPDKPKAYIHGDIRVATNGWGDSRQRYLQQSKYMLCTHQDGHPYIEPLRYVLAAAYGLPIIAEYSLDFYPYHYYVSPLEHLKDLVKYYARDKYYIGRNLRNFMLQNFQFRVCVEDFVRREFNA